ncbi:hypothetical protein QYF36_001540 [Acer negundo]|nr:hypothetical protein QYF36_001540 [Acer negundo]
MQSSTKMSLLTLQKIIDILYINPYCYFFRNLRGVSDLDNHKILIRSDVELDQRLYNSPSISQVAVVWVDDEPSSECRSRDIVVYGHAGRLLQQYVVDMYVKLETSRLDYFRNQQDVIRAELYQGIVNSIEVGEDRGSRVGRRVILPSSFIGGPRDMKKRYMDAMALVQRFGKPDIFLTMTCNPNWPELKQELGVNDEVESFRESARLFGLLDSDNSLEECLQEANVYQMPYTLRRLFATLLVYCRPANPRNLWEKFEVSMSEDYHRSGLNFFNARLKVLEHIHFVVESMGNNINDYHLVDYDIILNEDERCIKEINDELSIPISESDFSLKLSLTSKQKYAYDRILEKVFMQQSASFFIDGPGGTRKTYLYKAILATLRSKGIVALATTSSGVAASVLPGGRTTHSSVEKNMACSVSKQSGLTKLLQHAKLIIWEEAPMSHRLAIKVLDGMLQDINDSKQLFGGKVVVFGGDFRQILPVVQKARKEEMIDATEQWLKKLKKEDIADTSKNTPEFSFVPFSRLNNYIDSFDQVDIIALAIDVQPIRCIQTSFGTGSIQEVTLVN